MESGAIKIKNTADDGIQCDLDGDVSTGETGEHEVAIVFKTPDNGGNTLIVSTSGTTSLKSGTTSLKSGVTVNGGTEYFEGAAIIGATVSGGNAINLSQYTSNGGNRPGGGGGPGGH